MSYYGPPLSKNKWLTDRIDGQSKYGDRERPPCPCCWVPPIVGWYPGLLETNFFCRCWGGFGFFGTSETSRFVCLNIGIILNLCALMLTAYSCLAISDDFFVLTKSSFQELVMTEVNGAFDETIKMFVGVRAAALDNPVSGVGQVVVDFDQFCDLSGDGMERYVNPLDCNDCQDVSGNMIGSLLFSIATFLPTFFTEQLRMYSGYDVNCTKCFVTVLSILTVLLNLNAIISYAVVCGPSFYDGTVFYDANGDVVPPDAPAQDILYEVNFDWSYGYGFITLLVATCLKFIDLMINVCIRTPTVTRDQREQEIYETIGAAEMEAIQDDDPAVKSTTNLSQGV